MQRRAVVCGAGVVGLAVARSLSKAGLETFVIEKSASFGTGTSSRNSAVVHAGIYYRKDSLKARWCVEGRRSLYEYCAQAGVSTNMCGKLVVAGQGEENRLERLYANAIANGVNDVALLTADEIHDLEPLVEAQGGGLFSPSSGSVDVQDYLRSLLADAESNGAHIVFNAPIEEAYYSAPDSPISIMVAGEWMECDVFINCAGLHATNVAQLFHKDCHWNPPTQYFCKGSYFALSTKVSPPFSRLIYPLPSESGLGVHFTIDTTGGAQFGPDVEWLDPILNPDTIPLDPKPEKREAFYDAIRQYWPTIPNNSLMPSYSGVRPKLWHPSFKAIPGHIPGDDFLVCGKQNHGVHGLIHLFGIESPGLTSALAIADDIAMQSLI